MIEQTEYRVVCPNFGHPALTSSFTKYKFSQVKNSFAIIVSAFEWWSIIFMPTPCSIYKVPRMKKLVQGVRS